MGSKLFVGNLDYATTDQDLREAFGRFGNLVDVTVIIDRNTSRSRGFGFVEFGAEAEAQRATQEMDGVKLNGRAMNVSAARERSRGGGGDRGGSGRWGNR